MFVFEAILKYLKKDKFNEVLEEHDKEQTMHLLDYVPLEEDVETSEDVECEHVFMPIDSTGEILACAKCGEVKRKEDFEK